MAVNQSEFDVADRHSFSLGQVLILVKISFDKVSLTFSLGQVLKPFEHL
jgi:hypothetical protein